MNLRPRGTINYVNLHKQGHFMSHVGHHKGADRCRAPCRSSNTPRKPQRTIESTEGKGAHKDKGAHRKPLTSKLRSRQQEAAQFLQRVKHIKRTHLKGHKRALMRCFFQKVVAIIMSQIREASKFEQVSLKEGIRRFGEKSNLGSLEGICAA